MPLNDTSTLTLTVEGPAGSVTQARDVDAVPGYVETRNVEFTAGDWSAAFPFGHPGEISRISMDFTTLESDFNGGVGPNGGDPGVAVESVLTLSSFVTGNQRQVYDGSNPTTYTALTQMLSDGHVKFGLSGFEGFPTLSQPMPFAMASELTLSVTGVPEPASLYALVAAAVALATRRRRSNARAVSRH